MAPGLVTAEEIMEYDLDGDALDPRGRTPYVERFIHSEIYKVRPEMRGGVDSHSPAIIPFGATTVPLRPSSFLGARASGVRAPRGRRSGDRHADPQSRARRDAGAQARHPRGRIDARVQRCRGRVDPKGGVRAIYSEINAKLQAEASRLS
jgi:hypothetical protein